MRDHEGHDRAWAEADARDKRRGRGRRARRARRRVGVAAPGNVLVRTTRREDVPAVVGLIGEVAAEGRWILTEAPIEEKRLSELITASLEGETGTALVAEAEEAIVGNLGLHAAGPDSVWLGMSVARGWRGRGVGSALLEAALDWACGRGFRQVSLEVFPHNEAAISLYRKFGFVESERLRERYRRRNGEVWDALVMTRSLEPTAGVAPKPKQARRPARGGPASEK
ncbi:MAG TPA: GNAT family N-acetyltransferase [Gaiellaceae bacterium]